MRQVLGGAFILAAARLCQVPGFRDGVRCIWMEARLGPRRGIWASSSRHLGVDQNSCWKTTKAPDISATWEKYPEILISRMASPKCVTPLQPSDHRLESSTRRRTGGGFQHDLHWISAQESKSHAKIRSAERQRVLPTEFSGNALAKSCIHNIATLQHASTAPCATQKLALQQHSAQL